MCKAARILAVLTKGDNHEYASGALLEERVRKHGFIRARQSALVRLDGVRELTRTRAGALVAVLGSGVRIPISRRRSAAFTAALRQLGDTADH